MGNKAEKRSQKDPSECKQEQNWRNKEEEGIWNTWALRECQFAETKDWLWWLETMELCFLIWKKEDYTVMTQVIFPQTLGKALLAQFIDRHLSVQADSEKTC